MTDTFNRWVEFIKEVRNELRKVSWPAWEDIRGATIVILVTVFVFGFYLGIIDLVFSRGLPSSPLTALPWQLAAGGLLIIIAYLILLTTRG